MPKALTRTERVLVRERILQSTQPGPNREMQLYKWLCGHRAFPRRRAFIETFVRIPQKREAGRKIVPLIMNRPQRFIDVIRRKFEHAGLPFRGATLKARQWGISTLWLAYMIEEVTRNENVRACLLADEEALGKTLLETGKTIRDHLPFRLPTKYENRQQLYFDSPINGWIDIATAKSENPCRGRTYSFLHATEPGTWDNPERKVASVNQSVPNSPRTVLSYEGTANGTGNWWHDFWWDARNGNNDYYAFFFPWFSDWEFDYYLEPREGDVEKIMGNLDDEEQFLISKFSLNLGQLKWRRFHIRNNFFNDIDLFNQEFPSTPEIAWLSSGRPVFSSRHVQRARSKARDPIWRGDVLVGDFVDDRLEYRLSAAQRGSFKVWHHPEPHGTYIIASDSSEGGQVGDFAAFHVLEKESLAQCAQFHARVTPSELADAACCVGYHYNDAYFLPDVDGPGAATMQRAVERRYPSIGRRPVYGIVGKRTVPKFGWDTNKQTKYLMVNEVRYLIGLEEPPEINSEELLVEMMEYEVKEDLTYGAPSGRHDDLLEAYCVTVMAQKDVLLRGIPDTPPPEPKTATERHWRDFEDEVADSEGDKDEDFL